MNMSGILVHYIGDCLQTAADLFHSIKRQRENVLGIIIRNLKEILYERMVPRLHFVRTSGNSSAFRTDLRQFGVIFRLRIRKRNSASSLLSSL